MESTYSNNENSEQTSFSSLTDNELICVIRLTEDKENGKAAILAMISRYMKLVLKRANFFSENFSDVEDLAQEGLLAFYKAIDSFDLENGAKFSSYVDVCVSNAMKTAVGKYNKSSYCIVEDEPVSLSSPENICLDLESFSALRKNAENILSEVELSVFNLYVCGYSYKQISKKLDLSEKSVDNAVSRFKKKLRSSFEKN